MTTTTPRQVRPPSTRRLLRAMWIGLALTVIAGMVPLIDIATADTLYAHVRDAYPDWPADLVRGDRNAIAIYLGINAGLGALTWLFTIWAAAAGRRWTRGVVIAAFALGAGLALFNLTLTGGRYDTVLPPAYGALGLLPSLAGLAVLIMVWRRPAAN